MSSLEQDTQRQGPGVHKTGPILEERFIVMFTKKALTLLMSAALVLADIPGFGFQADPSLAPLPAESALASSQKLQQFTGENDEAVIEAQDIKEAA
jgi:hypothetical protein